MEYFEFIETPTFVRQREDLLDDDTFQQLQEYLLKQHVDGDTINTPVAVKSSGGIGQKPVNAVAFGLFITQSPAWESSIC